MIEKTEDPASAAAPTGSGKSSSLRTIDTPENKGTDAAAQEISNIVHIKEAKPRTSRRGNGKDKAADSAAVKSDDLSDAELDREIERLSKLKTVDYERIRKSRSEALGIRAPFLDSLVRKARPAESGQGRAIELLEPEPWPYAVNGIDLVQDMTAAIRKYVVLADSEALTCSLWSLHTYCFASFTCTPRLAITAPEKRCGKTTLLDVLSCLVPRPLPAANISSAATFRTIEAAWPTFLIDEGDTFLRDNEELRGILNSGHRKGGQVIRTVQEGNKLETRAFSTHCPVAIALIGKLPDTLADRSVAISMTAGTG
jgi:hypothetical protein